MFILFYSKILSGDIMEMEGTVPRYWPILCSLSKLEKIDGSSYLHGYLYLAKEEGKVPIQYEFIKEDHSPYSPSIQSDSLVLDNKGFIKMLEDGIYKITKEGRKLTKKITKNIPSEVVEGLHNILNKYKTYSFSELEIHFIEILSDYCKLQVVPKDQMILDINDLLEIFRSYETSKNSLFVRGSLDYCRLLLKRENLDNGPEKDVLISHISIYIDKITELDIFVRKSPDSLSDLSLSEVIEKFNRIQDLSKDFDLLPRLDDEIDLEIFFDDEDETFPAIF